MNPKNRTHGFTAWLTALVATLLALPALAGTYIDFEGTGTVQALGPPDESGNQSLFASGDYTFNGIPGWTLASPFSFNLGAGTGAGIFTFANNGDSLFGSLTSQGNYVEGSFLPIGFFLNYTILSGSGTYDGARGSGSSYVQLLGPVDPQDPFSPLKYAEGGQFHVPEPGTLALLGLGLAGVALSRRRRSK